ncbi:MAG: glutamine--tRNA ligase/YqeY domain fusion protein [Planctomycetes bacterium]|nr:glutamine--tRNA ligase/YqeY domain fusion protein [Planctomycetota bacterium]
MTENKAQDHPQDNPTGAAGDGRGARSNFIRTVIDEDLAAGRHTRVVTRFPPEPNGFLHIGHAKSICLNFGIALDYQGKCNLRFDDTNPLTENESYVRAIEADVRWLGFEWGATAYASDYFEFMFERAELLIRKGLAYVDSETQDEIAAKRGTIHEAGRAGAFRDRSVAENLDLFSRMRAGEFADGAHVLRAKIDLAHTNLLMRDPLLYRIRHASHYRRGESWCIYPMYDYAHPLEDAYEGVTHSLCSLEFETHRPLYDWVVRETEAPCRPQQIEFARLVLSYTVLSKRYLMQLVKEGHVSGWDDPRLPTLAGLRRRGVLPQSIRRFADMVGVARANSTVDMGKLEFVLRDDLSPIAPRVLCVLDPLEVVVTNWPEERTDWLDASLWPADVAMEGTRRLPFGRRLWIERGDFAETPPKGWHRLSPGAEVRLRHAYVLRCDAVERDASGAAVRLLCTADLATLNAAPVGRKVPGTIHWVAADHAVACEIRLYDRLFSTEAPGTDEARSFLTELNPASLVVMRDAKIEPSVVGSDPVTRWQFERQGYFQADPVDSTPSRPVFNRIVTLKDGWTKVATREEPAAPAPRAKAGPQPAQNPVTSSKRLSARADPTHAALVARGVDVDTADVLAADEALLAFFDGAVARSAADPALVARWVANEIVRETKTRRLADIPVTPQAFGDLVKLIADGTVSASAAKDVFARMAKDGTDPGAIVADAGLRQVSDASALGAVVDAVVAGHAADVARYRAGKTQLLGFFVGKVLQASGGSANPAMVRELLLARL